MPQAPKPRPGRPPAPKPPAQPRRPRPRRRTAPRRPTRPPRPSPGPSPRPPAPSRPPPRPFPPAGPRPGHPPFPRLPPGGLSPSLARLAGLGRIGGPLAFLALLLFWWWHQRSDSVPLPEGFWMCCGKVGPCCTTNNTRCDQSINLCNALGTPCQPCIQTGSPTTAFGLNYYDLPPGCAFPTRRTLVGHAARGTVNPVPIPTVPRQTEGLQPESQPNPGPAPKGHGRKWPGDPLPEPQPEPQPEPPPKPGPGTPPNPDNLPQWWPTVDPLVIPPGTPMPMPVPIPWWAIPYVPPFDPLRPNDQPERGPVPVPRPRPQPQPHPRPEHQPQPRPRPRPRPFPFPRPRPQPDPEIFPRPQMRPGTLSTPSAAVQPRLNPRYVPRRPPSRGTKDKKGMMPRWLMRVLSFATDKAEWIDAAWKALPCEVSNAYNPKSAVGRARVVYRHWDKVDLTEFASNVFWNEVEDRLFAISGRLSRAINRGPYWDRSGRGFQSGKSLRERDIRGAYEELVPPPIKGKCQQVRPLRRRFPAFSPQASEPFFQLNR